MLLIAIRPHGEGVDIEAQLLRIRIVDPEFLTKFYLETLAGVYESTDILIPSRLWGPSPAPYRVSGIVDTHGDTLPSPIKFATKKGNSLQKTLARLLIYLERTDV